MDLCSLQAALCIAYALVGNCGGFVTYLKYGDGISSSPDSAVIYLISDEHRCANLCYNQRSWCKAFIFNSTANTGECVLHSHVCPTGEGSDVYYISNNVNMSATTNNLALDKPASMSSLYNGSDGCCVAEHGNDGIYSGHVFHTVNEANPWWRVDMQAVFCIHAVYFMNRFEEKNDVNLWERTHNVMVTVSQLESDIMDNGGENRCGYIDGVAQQYDNLVTCSQPMLGKFVQLQMFHTNAFHLHEVEVHGN